MAKIEVVLSKKSDTVDIHIDLPEGDRCEEANDAFRTVMASFGAEFAGDVGPRPRQPEATTARGRTKTR